MTDGVIDGIVMTPELDADLSTPLPVIRPRPSESYSGQGREPTSPFGVMYQGEYETLWDGTAVAVRAHARALAGTGIPVFLKSFSSSVIDQYGRAQPAFHGIDPAVQKEIGHLELERPEVIFPIIKHTVVQDAEHLKALIIPKGAIGRDFDEQVKIRQQIFASTIVYSVWERDRVDPGIVKTLSKVADNWVPSDANALMLIASGVPQEKVHVIPHPYDPTDPLLKLRRRRPDTEWRKFYSIGRWEPRKGYCELVEAFLSAFTHHANAVLTIKYTGGKWPGYETPDELMARLTTDARLLAHGWTPETMRNRVRLIEGRFPRGAILELHFRNNIYVSASHGEAWCLPAFEAALAGNNVCYVPSGGVEDYLANGHTCVAPSLDVAVPASYRWESDAKWTGYSVESLMHALQHSYAPTASHDRPDSINLKRFTLEAVGKSMRSRVIAVSEWRPKVAEFYRGAVELAEDP